MGDTHGTVDIPGLTGLERSLCLHVPQAAVLKADRSVRLQALSKPFAKANLYSLFYGPNPNVVRLVTSVQAEFINYYHVSTFEFQNNPVK